MQDTNASSPRLSALDRLKVAMDASREYFRNIKHLAYERRGDNGAIGRISRFMARTSKSALGLFGRENTWTALALSTTFSNSTFNLFEAVKTLSFFASNTTQPTPPSVTEQLANSFDNVALGNAYVTPYVAAKLAAQEAAVQEQIATVFEDVSERVANGEYVGIQGLIAELNTVKNAAETEHNLKIVFDAQGPSTFAHCSDKVAGMMKAEFAGLNNTTQPAVASERVMTFGASADPTNTATTPITKLVPQAQAISGEPAVIPAHAYSPKTPRPHFGPRGI